MELTMLFCVGSMQPDYYCFYYRHVKDFFGRWGVVSLTMARVSAVGFLFLGAWFIRSKSLQEGNGICHLFSFRVCESFAI